MGEMKMNIDIDGIRYPVSMTWHPDDTLQHFVLVNGCWIDLKISAIASRSREPDPEDFPPIKHKEQRKMFEDRVREIINDHTLHSDL
jgi:hypothetical protein